MPSWRDLLVGVGLDPADAAPKVRLFQAATDALGAVADVDGDARAWFVPGRIEVLGKHTDYAGGRSIVCAASHGFCAVARPAASARVRAIDVSSGELVECALDEGEMSETDPRPWSTYLRAVARRVARNFPGTRGGVDLAFASDLPPAAGMSSSSALLVTTFLALAEVNKAEETSAYRHAIANKEQLAEYLATVENGQGYGRLAGDTGVGTFGGSEDHTAILCCRPHSLAQFSFAPTRFERSLPLGREWRFVIASSGVTAEKARAARDRYNRASLATGQLLDFWRTATGRDDRSLAAALDSAPGARDRLRALLDAADVGDWSRAELIHRYEQFCLESLEIVPAAGDALVAGDMSRFGALVDESQRAAERLLRNQVPETAWLARSARGLGAAAASAFGAGFGGSVWALVKATDVETFSARWRDEYAESFPARGASARFFVTRPGPAAVRVS